jgi:hypothetical protein
MPMLVRRSGMRQGDAGFPPKRGAVVKAPLRSESPAFKVEANCGGEASHRRGACRHFGRQVVAVPSTQFSPASPVLDKAVLLPHFWAEL